MLPSELTELAEASASANPQKAQVYALVAIAKQLDEVQARLGGILNQLSKR